MRLLPLTSTGGQPAQIPNPQVSTHWALPVHGRPLKEPPEQTKDEQVPLQLPAFTQGMAELEVQNWQSEFCVQACVLWFEQVLGPVMTAKEACSAPKLPQASPGAVQSVFFKQKVEPLLRQKCWPPAPPPFAALWLLMQTGLSRLQAVLRVPHVPKSVSGRRVTTWRNVAS